MKKEQLISKILVILFVPLSFVIALSAVDTPIKSSTTGSSAYKTMGVHANIEYEGSKYELPSKGSPLEMAYELLELNQDRIGIKNPRTVLEVRREVHDPLGAMVSFKQVYNGLEIAHSDLRVYFTPDGSLRDVVGEYHYDINLSTNYSIDSATAVGIALKDIGTMPETEVPLIRCPGKPIIVPSSELNLRDESKLYLVWPISIFTVTAESYYADSVDYGAGIKLRPLAPTGKEYIRYIEAHNGNIVKSGDSSLKDRRYRGPQ